ncbi:MAG: peptidoglycan-binding protein, partial [Planctomycetota bacterium]
AFVEPAAVVENNAVAGAPTSSTLGDLISRGEGGYNSFNRGRAGDSAGREIDFSQLTVGEVMRRQALPGSDPNRLFAVGRFQVIPSTLSGAVNNLGIDKNQRFTPELQEQIFADYLIDDKRPAVNNYITGKSDNLGAAQLALAQEFASVADPRTGRSFYDGIGNNSASITASEAGNALNEMRRQYQANIDRGLSPDAAYDALRGGSTSGTPTDPVETPPPKPARGDTGPEVQAVQDRLVQLGIMTPEEVATGPGIFGPRTEASVKEFQNAVGLSPSGVYDNATRSAADAIVSGVSRDRQNPDVTRGVQDRLVELGYMSRAQVNTGPGIFGPQTEAALKAFQADNNIEQNGILGATTFKALRQAGGSGSWPVPGFFEVNKADKPGEGDGEFGSFRSGGRTHKGIDINAPVGSR